MRRLVALLCFLSLSACYSFSYRTLEPPNYTEKAIDETNARSVVRWSYFWGLSGADVWNQKDLCGNDNPGKVAVELTGYSALLMLFTLGMVFPARVTVYCSTSEGPSP
jgi:hypothetical protein